MLIVTDSTVQPARNANGCCVVTALELHCSLNHALVSIHHGSYSTIICREGVLFGLGNPLLDISATVTDEFLAK